MMVNRQSYLLRGDRVRPAERAKDRLFVVGELIGEAVCCMLYCQK